jgi:hypothetical protein
MQTLCCQTVQASHPINARLSFGSSLPQMQRILSSSPESSSAAAALELFFVLALVAALAGFGFGAGEEEAFVCWPLVARPERRGSSAILCQPGIRQYARMSPLPSLFRWTGRYATLGGAV